MIIYYHINGMFFILFCIYDTCIWILFETMGLSLRLRYIGVVYMRTKLRIILSWYANLISTSILDKWLGRHEHSGNNTYTNEILENHRLFMASLNIPLKGKSEDVPCFYWIHKFHRTLYIDRSSAH